MPPPPPNKISPCIPKLKKKKFHCGMGSCVEDVRLCWVEYGNCSELGLYLQVLYREVQGACVVYDVGMIIGINIL